MTKILLSLSFTVLSLFGGNLLANSGIFAGGPVYYSRNYAIDELRNSGFTFVVVWTIHINEEGDLNFNAEFPICEDGHYIGDGQYPHFADDIARLKTAPTSIQRVEFGLSAWQSGTFDNIQDLIAAQGTGAGSVLYENFKSLKERIPQVDAINFDDESTFDTASATAFAVMLADLGYQVTLCPYTAHTFWSDVAAETNARRPGAVDGVYLQCYAGGAGNSPCAWNSYFNDIPVWPGLWDTYDTPQEVTDQMTVWRDLCGITGGWMWLYDDFDNSSLSAEYAQAINAVFGELTPPGLAYEPSPATGATDAPLYTNISWTSGLRAVSHDVYFGINPSPGAAEFKGNQSSRSFDPGAIEANTTYYWRVDEVNSEGTTQGDVWSFTTGSQSQISGNSLSFDAIDDFVDCGNDASLQLTGNQITMEAWIRVNNFRGSIFQGCIIAKDQGGSPGTDRGYMLRCGGQGQLNINIGDGNWHEYDSPAGSVPLREWAHVAGTYDGNRFRIYVNGALVGESAPVSVNIGATSQKNLRIGDSPLFPGRVFDGLIDEVRIWKTARTQAEIQGTMNSALDTSHYSNPDLVGYWAMNGNGDQIVPDFSSYANDGMLGSTSQGDTQDPMWNINGAPLTSSVVPAPSLLPRGFELKQNHPNPFNPETLISYELAESGPVTLTVHNLLGQTVIELVNTHQPAGQYDIRWDGRDARGVPVESGTYFYRLMAGSKFLTRKLTFIK